MWKELTVEKMHIHAHQISDGWRINRQPTFKIVRVLLLIARHWWTPDFSVLKPLRLELPRILGRLTSEVEGVQDDGRTTSHTHPPNSIEG